MQNLGGKQSVLWAIGKWSMGYLPLEPVTLVSQWRILKIKKDNLTEWSSL